MQGVWIAVFTIIGLAVGSFLNVCISRLPNSQSILFPPSRCTSCHHRLAIKDLVPVFSYLWLRGRCRYCQARLPKGMLWVEIGTGALFVFLYWHYGLTAELAVAAIYCCLFIILMAIDFEHGIIPNKIVYPSIVVALVISIFLSPSRVALVTRISSPPSELALLLSGLPQLGIVQSAIGGGIGLFLFLLIIVVSRGGIGWGDVKMAALIGIVTGYLVFVALLLAVIIGGLAAVILLSLKIKKRKEQIPFGPFLSLATIATLLFGSNILNWYLQLL